LIFFIHKKEEQKERETSGCELG